MPLRKRPSAQKNYSQSLSRLLVATLLIKAGAGWSQSTNTVPMAAVVPTLHLIQKAIRPEPLVFHAVNTRKYQRHACKKVIYSGTELEQYMEQTRNHPPCRLQLVGRIEISKPLVLDGIVLEGLINPTLGFNSAESPYLPIHSGRVNLSGPSMKLTVKAYNEILLPPDGLPILAASAKFQDGALLVTKTSGRIEKLVLEAPAKESAIAPFQKTAIAHYLDLQHIFLVSVDVSDAYMPLTIELADNKEASTTTLSRQVSSTNSSAQNTQSQVSGAPSRARTRLSSDGEPPEEDKITSYDPEPPADSEPDVQSQTSWAEMHRAVLLEANKKRSAPGAGSSYSLARSKFENKQPPPTAPKPKERRRILPAVTQQTESNPEAATQPKADSQRASDNKDPLESISERLKRLKALNQEAQESLARVDKILKEKDKKTEEGKEKFQPQ